MYLLIQDVRLPFTTDFYAHLKELTETNNLIKKVTDDKVGSE